MRVAIAVLVCSAAVRAQVQQRTPQPTDARGWKSHGVSLYKEAKYQEAIEAFERVTAITPRDAIAYLYLGTTLMQIWIPGQQSPENAQTARRAAREFEKALEIEPNNTVALESLTSLSYTEGKLLPYDEKMRKMDEARGWNRRLIEVDPWNRDARYWAGVLAWSEFYPALMTARVKAKMKPEDPGPLPASNDKTGLISTYGPMVDGGIEDLRRAIEIDPQYADAMAYLNLLIRERADLRDTTDEYRREVAEADIWVGRAVEAKKFSPQSLPIPSPVPVTPANAPPQNAIPVPPRIRVDGNVQRANLIRSVEPVCTPLAVQANISGVVKYTMIIGQNGKTQNFQLISGHPLLLPAALEALKQREYRPTLLNGEPVEVITTVDLNMHCDR
jgi:tetratricopeptide (TPR) repeat protein